MKKSSLPEAVALLIVVAIAAAAVFLTQASPDLWDVLHARAMGAAGCGL